MDQQFWVSRMLLPHGVFRVRVLAALIRNQWFIRLRWVFAAAGLGLLTIEHMFTGVERPLALWLVISALAVVNTMWSVVGIRVRSDMSAGPESVAGRNPQTPNGAQSGERPRAYPVAQSLSRSGVSPAWIGRAVQFVNAQMVIDLLLLTLLLLFSGGLENPMAIFYLFHVLIAALLLKPLNALFQGGWAVLLYIALGVGDVTQILPRFPLILVNGIETIAGHSWQGVVVSVGILAMGVLGTLFFTLQISWRCDEQEQELEAACDALRVSRDAITTLQARRTRFMRTAAHQLKGPLTGIEMLAGLVRDDVVGEDGVKGVVDRIIRRSEDAMVQVEELLTLERLEDALPGRHHGARADVLTVLQHIESRFRDQAIAKGISLHVDTGDCLGAMAAVDERDLRDCLNNLVENALKYTKTGGQVWVSCACVANGGSAQVKITVKDTGMGIIEDQEDELFDPFRRGHLALQAQIPGSGLGLAIVREVVEQADGRIVVKSQVGVGTEFQVFFPRAGEAGDRPMYPANSVVTFQITRRSATLA